jgi:trehalose 6-phosphate synthase/phosphatase
VERWAKDFIDNLVSVKKLQHELDTKRLIENRKQKLIDKYLKTESNERLLLLDYDGTLTSFAPTPEKAKPDKKLLKLLKKLADEGEVILISGRKKNSLEKWFGRLNVGLVAEHGTWLKEKGKSWELLEPLRNEWKEEIRPILEVYVDRTPRSFIEEKSFSLVWHYRRADPELSYIRAKELSDTLTYLIADSDLGVLEGNKVIEVKNTSITKGKAALHWISKKQWNFILAVGDDITDEDTFSVLPEAAYSIKIGLGSSHARYNLRTPQELREILHEFIA